MGADYLEKRFEIVEGEDADCVLQQLRRITEDAQLGKQTLYIEVWAPGKKETKGQMRLPFLPASGCLGRNDLCADSS